jgi:hypothetical protein
VSSQLLIADSSSHPKQDYSGKQVLFAIQTSIIQSNSAAAAPRVAHPGTQAGR